MGHILKKNSFIQNSNITGHPRFLFVKYSNSILVAIVNSIFLSSYFQTGYC